MIKLLTPWPALMLEEDKTMVIADLHLGFEYELSKMGISIPYQTGRLMEELFSIIREYRPRRLVILGDLKHGIPITSFQERREIPEFLTSLSKEVEHVVVVRGNHDGGLQDIVPEGIDMVSSKGLLLGEKYKVGAFHGHAWPGAKLLGCDLMILGHSHPTVLLRTPLGIRLTRRVWARGVCTREKLAAAYLEKDGIAFEGDAVQKFEETHKSSVLNSEVILMPAFNDLLGGLPVNSETPKTLLGPLLRTKTIDTTDFEIYLLDGTYLGRVGFLRTLS